ncbi:MAG: ribonuclease E/G, partial [Marinobacter sp.]
DMGGLIVIDFIDMTPAKHQREVEHKMREALEIDRARVQVGKISRFGLLEMSRQRLRPSLGETRSEVCPRCEGQGTIRGIESLALSIMRLIYEESSKEKTAEVRAIVPVSVATFLLNEKRKQLADIEAGQGVSIVVAPVPNMETPHFEIIRMRQDETAPEHISSHQVAHEYNEREEESAVEVTSTEKPVREKAAVKAIRPAPAPVVKAAAKAETVDSDEGSFRKLCKKIASFFSGEADTASASNQTTKSAGSNRRPQARPDRQDRRKSRVARDDQRGGNRTGNERRQNNRNRPNRNDDQNRGAQSRQNQQDKPADNKGNDNRRDGRKEGQNRGQGRNRPQRDAKDQKDLKDQKDNQPNQKGPSNDKSGDDKRRKPRRQRNRDGSPAEAPVSTPAARKAERSDKHQKDTQPEKAVEEKTSSASKAAVETESKAKDANTQPQAKKPVEQNTKAEESKPAAAEPKAETAKPATKEQDAAPKAKEEAKPASTDEALKAESESKAEAKADENKPEKRKPAPRQRKPQASKEAKTEQTSEAPKATEPVADSKDKADAPKAEAPKAEKAEKAEKPAETSEKPKATVKADPKPEAEPKAEPAKAEAPSAIDVPVTPGRAYNDPREVRKRQRAAEAAKKAEDN